MNIKDVLLWLECRHGDVYATDQCHSNSRINQILPQIIQILRFFW